MSAIFIQHYEPSTEYEILFKPTLAFRQNMTTTVLVRLSGYSTVPQYANRESMWEMGN
jgi:hypothetical protein